MEILRYRHQEQLSGAWVLPPGLHAGADLTGAGQADVRFGAGAGAANASATAGGAIAGAPGTASNSFMDPPPRQISRGEQAGQEVIARLSRLHAAAGVAPVPSPGAGHGRAGIVPNGPQGLGMQSSPYSHRQVLQAVEYARQQQRRYHQALMAVSGGGFPLNGGGGVGVGGLGVGRDVGYGDAGMGGVMPGVVGVGGGGAGGVGGGAGGAGGGAVPGGGRPVSVVQVAQ